MDPLDRWEPIAKPDVVLSGGPETVFHDDADLLDGIPDCVPVVGFGSRF